MLTYIEIWPFLRYSATLYRDVPFSAIYWPCYELFKGLTLSEEHQVGIQFKLEPNFTVYYPFSH